MAAALPATCGDLQPCTLDRGARFGVRSRSEILALLRWLGVLIFLTILTALMSLGVIPTGAAGMAHMLVVAYATLLAISLVIGIALL
jgi:hypothetical protein